MMAAAWDIRLATLPDWEDTMAVVMDMAERRTPMTKGFAWKASDRRMGK